MEQVLITKKLTKNFGQLTAVDQLDLEIPRGSVYGILGPNGSGKTTTLGMITGILRPSSGSFEWFGDPTQHFQKKLGAILETPNFYDKLNALENLKIIQHIKNNYADDLGALLKKVELYDRRKSNFARYSLGMKQRLAIAAALIGQPEVIVFDEPTNGLDPQGIADIRELIGDIAASGMTVILASHMLAEVEKLCSHVAILKSGQLLYSGAVDQISGKDQMVVISAEDNQKLVESLRSRRLAEEIRPHEKGLLVQLYGEVSIAELNRQLVMEGHAIHRLQEQSFDLESHFMKTVSQ